MTSFRFLYFFKIGSSTLKIAQVLYARMACCSFLCLINATDKLGHFLPRMATGSQSVLFQTHLSLEAFSPWAKWLKMADRYHFWGRRPPYIKLKLIMCRFQKKYDGNAVSVAKGCHVTLNVA